MKPKIYWSVATRVGLQNTASNKKDTVERNGTAGMLLSDQTRNRSNCKPSPVIHGKLSAPVTKKTEINLLQEIACHSKYSQDRTLPHKQEGVLFSPSRDEWWKWPSKVTVHDVNDMTGNRGLNRGQYTLSSCTNLNRKEKTSSWF